MAERQILFLGEAYAKDFVRKLDALVHDTQGMLDLSGYGVRVGALWTAMLFIGGPIADVSYPLSRMAAKDASSGHGLSGVALHGVQPLECILAASCGSFFIVALASLRIFLGWSYVSDRLLSAVVEYEETGWYDGQLWVKSPEVLARDRMLGSYQVKPVLDRMKTTLLASGAALLASSLLLGAVTAVETEESYRPRVTNDGITYRTALREDDDVFSLDNLDYDDEAAAAEAAAAGRTGLPAYCGDRYYKLRVFETRAKYIRCFQLKICCDKDRSMYAKKVLDWLLEIAFV
eukprot:gene3040-3865_t